MNKVTNKRGSRLVNRRVQGRFVLRVLLYWVGYHVALFHAVFLFRILSHRLDVAGGSSPLLPVGDLYRQFFQEQQFLLFCALAAFPIVARDVIAWTHRVVGPLIRFQRVLEQLTRGEQVKSVKLRKGDLLVEFQQSFNDYLSFVNGEAKPVAAKASQPSEPAPAAQPEPDAPEHKLLHDVESLQHEVSQAGAASETLETARHS